MVQQVLDENPNRSRHALTKAAKTAVALKEVEELTDQLHTLPKQGEMARHLEGNAANLWAKSVGQLPPEPMKFALNAALETLPTNSNLRQWGKKSTDTCPLCMGKQTLSHVLNNCPKAMDLRRYSSRHDEVLKPIAAFANDHLPPSFSITVDLPDSSYSFPHHITPTNLRPDLVWWSDSDWVLWLLELTISFETAAEEARLRKRAKYQDLVSEATAAGYSTELVTVEVGSRGTVDEHELSTLQAAFDATTKEVNTLASHIIRATLLGSFKIWCSRNLTQ